MSQLRLASLLSVVVQAMIWIGVAIIYLIVNALLNLPSQVASGTAGTSTIPSWITPGTFYIAIGLLAAGLFIGIVGFVFFYLGFRSIRRGAPNFGAPTTLMVIGLVGYLMMAIGSVVIVGTIVAAINSATSASGASLAIGAIIGGGALIAFGSILGLIGVIGLVLGNWRAGKRYDEGSIRAGSILTIIPFASIIGFVLLLVGYSRASSKMSSGWSPAGAGPMSYGMPPSPGYPAPAAPGMAPPTAAPNCPSCGQPTTWNGQYNRWYCTHEQKFV